MNIKIYSIFSNDVFVVFESLYGYGVKTAKATQLAKIVNRMTYSKVLFFCYNQSISNELTKIHVDLFTITDVLNNLIIQKDTSIQLY